MIAALQLRAGASKVVVANNNASSGIAKGRQFERWCHADFDKATIEHDIVALQQAGRDGVVALVHAGEPCTAAALALGLVIHALVFPSSSSSSSSSLPLPPFISLSRARGAAFSSHHVHQTPNTHPATQIRRLHTWSEQVPKVISGALTAGR